MLESRNPNLHAGLLRLRQADVQEAEVVEPLSRDLSFYLNRYLGLLGVPSPLRQAATQVVV
jgi:hypothetical protein